MARLAGVEAQEPEVVAPLFLHQLGDALGHEDHRVVPSFKLEEFPIRGVAILRGELVERAGRGRRAVDEGLRQLSCVPVQADLLRHGPIRMPHLARLHEGDVLGLRQTP